MVLSRGGDVKSLWDVAIESEAHDRSLTMSSGNTCKGT